MKYFKKICGGKVYLSPMNTEDTETYTKWLNDEAVSVNLGLYRKQISLFNEAKALETMAESGYNYAIVRLKDDKLIGNISFHEMDNVSRKAVVGLFIGDDEDRGQGFGTEALKLILCYGFNTLNLHNIMLYVHADNENAIAVYKKIGFKEMGRRRDGTFVKGKYIDVIFMDILENEFVKD